jgi:RHS repeat-associated protein
MWHSIVQHGDQLLAQQRREGDVSVNALLATDLQRSVLHTLDKNPAPQPIAYSPYGYRRGESGLTSLLGFSGERRDPVTGLYLLGNGYRAFNPVLMRFNSPDSLSPFGRGGLNPYAYCLGDPVNRYDPTGNVPGKVSVEINKLIDKFSMAVFSEFERRTYKNIIGFDELKDVAKNKQVTYDAGALGEQVLKFKDSAMDPALAIKSRDDIVKVSFKRKRNYKNNFYFCQLDKAQRARDRGRIDFLDKISSEKVYKAFDGKKVEAFRGGFGEDSNHARNFLEALKNETSENIKYVQEDTLRIRDRYFDN